MAADSRLAWLGERVAEGLSTAPATFKRLLDDANSKKLLLKLVDNAMDGANPTLLFYTTQMEETYARLLAGKMTAAEPEPEPEPEPAPAPAAAEGDDAAADGADGSAAVEGGEGAAPAVGEATAPAEGASGKDGAEASAAPAEAAAPVSPPPPPAAKRGPPPLDPADLLQLHVCVPSTLPDAACGSGLVYFTLMVNEPIDASGGADAIDAAMNVALDHGVVCGGSLAMLEQVRN